MAEFGEFKDERDGHVYKTVRIGKQIWLAENFRFDCAGSKVYNGKEENLRKHGRLYTWRSAMNSAPDGWRLPGMEDWDELIGFAGGTLKAGTALKSGNGWSWNGAFDEDGNGTDEFGFRARPGGYGSFNGSFHDMGTLGAWWSSSTNRARNGEVATCLETSSYRSDASTGLYGKRSFVSVRYVGS